MVKWPSIILWHWALPHRLSLFGRRKRVSSHSRTSSNHMIRGRLLLDGSDDNTVVDASCSVLLEHSSLDTSYEAYTLIIHMQHDKKSKECMQKWNKSNRPMWASMLIFRFIHVWSSQLHDSKALGPSQALSTCHIHDELHIFLLAPRTFLLAFPTSITSLLPDWPLHTTLYPWHADLIPLDISASHCSISSDAHICAVCQQCNAKHPLMYDVQIVDCTSWLTLLALLAAQPALVSTLSTAKNITILAPNNAAFKNWMGTKIGEEVAKMPDMVTALLEYHVLKATVPSTAIMATPAFVPTYLSNATYSNVTGGQVVEAVKMGGMVMIYSGLRMNSTVVTAVSIWWIRTRCSQTDVDRI